MKHIALTSVAAAALLLSTAVSAQGLQMSTYLGASGGVSSWNADCTGTTSCKKNPVTVRAFGGYHVMPNVALELTLASLGTMKASVPGGQLDVRGNSYDLSGVYKFGDWRSGFGGFVKGGLAYTTAKATSTVGTVGTSSNKNAWGLLVGAGVTYAVTPNFSLRGELDTQKVKIPGSSGNVTSFTVGGQGQF